MDFKDFVKSNKKNKSAGEGSQMGGVPMNDIEGQIRQYENMSKGDMMDELRRAKQSGQMNEQSLRNFLDMMGNNISEQQKNQIINMVRNLD